MGEDLWLLRLLGVFLLLTSAWSFVECVYMQDDARAPPSAGFVLWASVLGFVGHLTTFIYYTACKESGLPFVPVFAGSCGLLLATAKAAILASAEVLRYKAHRRGAASSASLLECFIGSFIALWAHPWTAQLPRHPRDAERTPRGPKPGPGCSDARSVMRM